MAYFADGPGLYHADGHKWDVAAHSKLFWCDSDDVVWLAERMCRVSDEQFDQNAIDHMISLFKKGSDMQLVPFLAPHWHVSVAHNLATEFRNMRLRRQANIQNT